MPIIGMNFTSISARLYPDKKIDENINVNSSPTIEKVEKREIGLQNMKEALAIKFRFDTEYNPKIGEISLHGEVLYTSDKQKNIIDKWEKDKKLDDAVAVEVMNALFRSAIITGSATGTLYFP